MKVVEWNPRLLLNINQFGTSSPSNTQMIEGDWELPKIWNIITWATRISDVLVLNCTDYQQEHFATSTMIWPALHLNAYLQVKVTIATMIATVTEQVSLTRRLTVMETSAWNTKILFSGTEAIVVSSRSKKQVDDAEGLNKGCVYRDSNA